MHVQTFTCKKCGKKVPAIVPDGAKWVKCTECGEMIRIKG